MNYELMLHYSYNTHFGLVTRNATDLSHSAVQVTAISFATFQVHPTEGRTS